MSMAFNTNFDTTPAPQAQYATFDPNLGRYLTYDEMAQYGLVGAGSPNGQISRAQYESEIFRIQNPAKPAAAPPSPSGLTSAQQSAKALINSSLHEYGLDQLADWMWQEYLNGVPIDAIFLEMRQRPEFIKRFPAIKERQDKGLAPISVQEYLAYERQARQIMSAAGLPAGFYDSPDDFSGFISKDMSISELTSRINEGYLKVTQAPPEVRNLFAQFFGPKGDANLAALFLDDEKALPVLEKQIAAAQFAGYGQVAGFNFNRDQALRAADFARDEGTIRQGMGQLGELRSLFTETIGERTNLRAEEEGVSSVFLNDANASAAIKRRKQERQGQFTGGGGAYVSGNQSGLGGSS